MREWDVEARLPYLCRAGRPIPFVQLRIVDAQMKDVAHDGASQGEVVVRSPWLTQGYLGESDRSEELWNGGWLHTGDVGVMDEDGFLTLVDRSKDLIISGGSNIYPREIEEVLLRHPGVHEASVVGRPHPEWGEEVVAFVVRRPGTAASEAELDRLCLENIARFKRPKLYRFVDRLPKNNYGKVLKTELRAELRTAGEKP
jgi:acyl-CoA synthetase (AMP-forming)/AMP-acid ligase II